MQRWMCPMHARGFVKSLRRWSRLTPGARSLAIWKLADLLEANAERFARAEADNTGKPYGFVSLGTNHRLGQRIR